MTVMVARMLSGEQLDVVLADGGIAPLIPTPGDQLSTPNVVSATNTAPLSAANPLVWTSPAISQKGSGVVVVAASGCPVLTSGGGTVIAFGLTRDFGTPGAVQLGTAGTPIQRFIVPAGAGQHAEGAITMFVDVLPDALPHTYSLVMSTASTTMVDSAGHQFITVVEL